MNRVHLLTHLSVEKILTTEWKQALDRHHWAIGPYCIMPNHVHFFCRPCPEATSLSLFIGSWKEWTSKQTKNSLKRSEPTWQPEFFDHLLRNEENRSDKWEYVLNNPVRANLVGTAADWPYSGTIHYAY